MHTEKECPRCKSKRLKAVVQLKGIVKLIENEWKFPHIKNVEAIEEEYSFVECDDCHLQFIGYTFIDGYLNEILEEKK